MKSTDQLLTTLANSRTYTLSVATAMPDNAYPFKPAGAGWDFGELLNHIAYGIAWWEENFIKGNTTDWAPPAVSNIKKDILDRLENAYNALEKTISTIILTEKAIHGFHATIDHITHHRGQSVCYLRCNGLTPPEYTY